MYNGLIIAYMAELGYPDLAAEMADVLLRLEKARWLICVGLYQGALVLSVGTRSREQAPEKRVLGVVPGEGSAGGHGRMAGVRSSWQTDVLSRSAATLPAHITASVNPVGERRGAAHLRRTEPPKPVA